MLSVVLLGVLTTTPPPLPPPPMPPPVVAPPPMPVAPPVSAPQRSFQVAQPKPPPLPKKPSSFGLMFHPLNLFALSLWVEGDLHLASGASLFVNAGGGFLGQLGWDAGFRYYSSGQHLEGFYLDLRGSVFSLPAHTVWMAGSGVQLGYTWRTPAIVVAVAFGVTTWFNINAGTTSAQFLGSAPVEGDVMLFPGVSRPGSDRPSVQPTVRLAIGPWF